MGATPSAHVDCCIAANMARCAPVIMKKGSISIVRSYGRARRGSSICSVTGIERKSASANPMLSVQNMTLDSFLPLSRMKELSASAHSSYINARPFPHIVFDDFFDPSLLDLVLVEFPQPGAIRWQHFDNEREIKLASASEASFGPATRLLLYHLNSITFLEFLSEVTGIASLIPDPSFEGGGLHQIVRGGKLAIHTDFNRHRNYNLDRRLNLLLYLNKDWRDEYGGHLQLWDRDMTRCEAKVLPLFNRVVI